MLVALSELDPTKAMDFVILYMLLLKPVYLLMLFILTFTKHLILYHTINCSVNYALLKFLVNCGDGSMSTYPQDNSMCQSIIKYRTFFLFVRVFPKAVSWDHFFLLCMSTTYPIISTIVLHTSLLMMLNVSLYSNTSRPNVF